MTSLHLTLTATLSCRRERKIDITAGAKVRVDRWDGSTATCTVDDSGLDSKDGRTVLSFTDDTWAYTDQISGGSPAKANSSEVSHYQDDDGWGDDSDWD